MAIDDSSQDAIYQTDELLSPLSKMQKYMNSHNIFHRQMVVRTILETLRSVIDSSGETTTVINIMCSLSDDGEPSVRAELMEQVPHIAMFCHEYRDRLYFTPSQYLLPIVIRYLSDQHNLVRKTSQAALLVLLEQDLLHKADIEDIVCPAILQLTATDNFDEFRTEGVALMSKMAPLIGRDMTEKHFLRSFASLCMDTLFQVRKVCAANLGDICNIVAIDSTENILLPRFSYLCDDAIWGVRKACADVFTAVSYSCSTETRRQELAPLFVNLLCDQSRWVRMAAFQALGPFISTYADPKRTGIYYTEKGLEIYSDHIIEETGDISAVTLGSDSMVDNALSVDTSSTMDPTLQLLSTSQPVVLCGDSASLKLGIASTGVCGEQESAHSAYQDVCNNNSDSGNEEDAYRTDEKVICSGIDSLLTGESNKSQLNVSTSSQGHVHLHVDNESAFNSFHFWRIPIPDIELDIDIVEGKPTSVHVKAKVHSEEHKRVYSSELSVQLSQSESCLTGSSAKIGIQEMTSKNPSCSSSSDDVETSECDSELNQTCSESVPSVIHTQIRTASVGTTQDEIAEGVIETLASNVNETLVTIVNGEIKDVQRPQVVDVCVDSNEGNSVLYPSLLFETAAASRQNIVPYELLAHYINMSDPSLVQTVDTEITCHCAYSLPAVAMTLGKKNWPILRRLYETLAGDMQWKVRRTLAFSIHELAMILGEDLSTQDLVPIFNGFIKDLDEVRIGVLRHLTDFLKFLSLQVRQQYLPKLPEFLKTDNERNWRFRLELAEQLGLMAELYSPNQVRDYLIPIGVLLVGDKVAQVRQMALKKISILVKRLSLSDDLVLIKGFLIEIAENFAHHQKWIHRQTFASLCNHFVDKRSLSLSQFANDMLPHLLNLSYDPVPNVRISVANALSQSIIPQEYYQNPHHELLAEVMKRLQTDSDRDVRYYACLGSQNVRLGQPCVPNQLT